jgi:hypothetical protein
MTPLCCYKSQKAQSFICIGAGIGGLVTALVWFWQYSAWNTAASAVDTIEVTSTTTGNTWGSSSIDNSETVTNAVSDAVSLMATIFLVLGTFPSPLMQF